MREPRQPDQLQDLRRREEGMTTGTLIVGAVVIILLVAALAVSWRMMRGPKTCCGGDKTSLRDRPHASVRKEQ
jgi:predicted metalloprotease